MEPTLNLDLKEIGKRAKIASRELALLNNVEKNHILNQIQSYLLEDKEKILEENKKDIEAARANKMKESLIDRLLLTEDRIKDMADSISILKNQEDPIGKILSMKTMDNGLLIGQRTVPMGVLAIIYESRPNVTLDAAILAIKSGNAIILRGGKEAIHSNRAIASSIRRAIEEMSYDPNMVCFVDDTSRQSSIDLMGLRGYVDLLIPRGSSRLIQSVVENAKVPTLETGVGNCHLYIDKEADVAMALDIFENAKTTRTGVCNAMESLLIHQDLSQDFYDRLQGIIDKHGILVHGDGQVANKISNVIPINNEDYGMEYLNLEMSVKIVASLEEAIDHIQEFSTGHSESIVTENIQSALRFLNEVDSACVYVNASTRFTDGGEFGLGAEMGISTQKLHARGPIGIDQLTSSKFVIIGKGQVRK